MDWVRQVEPGELRRGEPYRFEAPEQRLRRRLLLEQELPGTHPAGVQAQPVAPPPPDAVRLGLADALRIGAAHNPDYQNRKEAIFRAALGLEVESDAFRTSWAGVLSGQYRDNRGGETPRRDVGASFEPGVSRLLDIGATVTTRLAFDLTRLLTLDRDTAYGLLADASVSLPLLRGAGRRIVLEPLTQAERNVVYAMYDFERHKRSYAVRIGSEYLGVLERERQIENAEDNYRRLEISTVRAERMADAGRLPATQVDQTRQDLLRARERLIGARQDHQRQLDEFKRTLGLPTDARIDLDPTVLERLEQRMAASEAERDDEPEDNLTAWSDDPAWGDRGSGEAIRIALAHRLDLRRLEGRIEDARRGIDVARDALRGSVTVEGAATYGERREVGSAERGDARLRPGEGRYRARLQWEPPWRRTREQSRYRESLLDLERARRDHQDLEDLVKQQVRDHLRGLQRAHESRRIQARAVELAERRVASTELFQQAGRAQIRDVLEAQEALVSARNALLAATVRCLTTEWSLMRDMDVLHVSDEGMTDDVLFQE